MITNQTETISLKNQSFDNDNGKLNFSFLLICMCVFGFSGKTFILYSIF